MFRLDSSDETRHTEVNQGTGQNSKRVTGDEVNKGSCPIHLAQAKAEMVQRDHRLYQKQAIV